MTYKEKIMFSILHKDTEKVTLISSDYYIKYLNVVLNFT